MDSQAPILQQEKSFIVTNPFIPQKQQEKELQVIEKSANSIVENAYQQNQTSSIANVSLKNLTKNSSKAISGFFDDLFVKPQGTPWIKYLSHILFKDQRYAYIGFVLIFIALLIYVFKNK